MKNSIFSKSILMLFVIGISITLLSCAKPEAGKDGKDQAKDGKAAIEKEITTVLNKFNDAFVKKDLNAVLAMVDSTTGPVMLGSCENENTTTFAAFKEMCEKGFQMPGTFECSMNNVKIHSEGNVAWFSSDFTMKMNYEGKDTTAKYTYSGVLVKRQAGWLFAQTHMARQCTCQGNCADKSQEPCCDKDKAKGPCCDKDKHDKK
jgi:ketosteroid isomerase-like protein